ncbi:hypothetical protein BT96DRAFT_1007301 [Gymnopus androsaceus JB14]|uniref:Uncharacterized protein n=1 Tax=Gymnopus androsaceus JB14 TaxID=1447944 RepID=A0A6A4GI12_9AGAR|nr:hypothetical protein BT96DRAFT_1007301 [Gymnopus androsaceus JB14]
MSLHSFPESERTVFPTPPLENYKTGAALTGTKLNFRAQPQAPAAGIVTEFLVPSGTSSGATTFEFVEVYSITEESFSGTVTVPEPTVSTLTGT